MLRTSGEANIGAEGVCAASTSGLAMGAPQDFQDLKNRTLVSPLTSIKI